MRFLQADLVYPIHRDPIPNGIVVLNDDNSIREILDSAEGIDLLQIEKHKGSICPGFINTHCHLELSHLFKKIEQGKGLIQFAKEVVAQRGRFQEEEILAAMKTANDTMLSNGIVAVGDISNVSQSFSTKSTSRIHYHTFIELIGLNPANADKIIQNGKNLLHEAKSKKLSVSLAPHAPYSTSFDIMNEAARYSKSNRVPISIHNQESEEENKLFIEKSGGYLDLYNHLNLSIDYFNASGNTSLQTYFPHIQDCHSLLLVHNTFSTTKDLQLANKAGNVYWCLCPNANLFIENTLPDIQGMEKAGCIITIGTDSLASNHQLSIASEIKTIKTKLPKIGMDQLLKWATLHGATFLGIENNYGTLEKGKSPGIVLLDEEHFTSKLLAF